MFAVASIIKAMKNLLYLLLIGLLVAGCSKSDEESESLGKEISGRMKSPIEKTKGITDKIGNMRKAERDLTK